MPRNVRAIQFANPNLPKRFLTVIQDQFQVFGSHEESKLDLEDPNLVQDSDILRWLSDDRLLRLPQMGTGTVRKLMEILGIVQVPTTKFYGSGIDPINDDNIFQIKPMTVHDLIIALTKCNPDDPAIVTLGGDRFYDIERVINSIAHTATLVCFRRFPKQERLI